MTDGRDQQRFVEESVIAAPQVDDDPARARSEAGHAGYFASRAGWALASFGATMSIKLGLNVVLSRLLAPEIFGIMVIVNALRVGVELLTDVGIEQNIVHNRRGLEPDFFNTAWTLQMLRGAGLALIFLALAPLAAAFYAIDVRVFLLVSLAPLLNSLHSTAIFVLVKQLEVKKRNLFELTAELFNFAVCCLFAWASPTVWSLLAGVLVAIGFRSALSYALPHPAHRVVLRREHVGTILRFGRWIFLASLLTYAAANFDRLALGRLAPLALLGIYGLARTIAELPATLAGRISYQVIFPYLSAGAGERVTVDRAMGRARLAFLVLAAGGIATVAGWSDHAVDLLYDPRFHRAGPMLCLLLPAAWVAVVATLNEALVLGAGHPRAIGTAGVVRVALIAIGLPAGYLLHGFAGAIAAILAGELARYALLARAQARLGLLLARQDALATLAFAAMLLGWVAVRYATDMGMPWTGLA